MTRTTTHETSLALRRASRPMNTSARDRSIPMPRQKPSLVCKDSRAHPPSPPTPTLDDLRKMSRKSMAIWNQPPKILFANSASPLVTTWKILQTSLAKELPACRALFATTSVVERTRTRSDDSVNTTTHLIPWRWFFRRAWSEQRAKKPVE